MVENGRRYSRNTVDIFRLSPVGRITKSHRGTPSPVKWTKAGRTVRRGQLYIAGGQTWDGGFNYDGLSNIGRYNIKDNMWEILPNSSFRGGYPEHYGRTWGPALFTMNNKLYVIMRWAGMRVLTLLHLWKQWICTTLLKAGLNKR